MKPARAVALSLLAGVLVFGSPLLAQERPLVAGADGVPVPKKTKAVKPTYPPEALAQGLRGIVILDLLIDTQGKVASTTVVRSVPGLDEAAIAAARQWEYEPTKVDGKPVSVRLTVPITFTLALPTLARDSGIPELRQGVAPAMPQGAEAGSVVAEVTLEGDGRVGTARVVEGTEPWAGALLAALQTWRFSPPPEDASLSFRVEARFAPARGSEPGRIALKATGLQRSDMLASDAPAAAAPTPASTAPVTAAPAAAPVGAAPAAAPAAPAAAAPAAASPTAAPAGAAPASGKPAESAPPPAQAPAKPESNAPSRTADAQSPPPAAPPSGAPAAPGSAPDIPSPRTPPPAPRAPGGTAPGATPPAGGPPPAATPPPPPAPAPGGGPATLAAPAGRNAAPPVEVITAPPPPLPPENGVSAVRDVTLEPGVPDLTRGRRPVAPPLARMSGTTGIVEVAFSVGAAGSSLVQNVSGPDLLKKAAEQAVASWVFRRTRADRAYLTATFNFAADKTAAVVRPQAPAAAGTAPAALASPAVPPPAVPSPAVPPPAGTTVAPQPAGPAQQPAPQPSTPRPQQPPSQQP